MLRTVGCVLDKRLCADTIPVSRYGSMCDPVTFYSRQRRKALFPFQASHTSDSIIALLNSTQLNFPFQHGI